MKIVKRNGKIVDYDAEKIRIAIKKANNDVDDLDKASDAEINKIIKYIENSNKHKKRLLVEDIQDIIEKKLVELNKYELSKCYMLYRYERELIRRANTTDESILTLIKNSNKDIKNKNANTALAKRDLIASEVSKDLTRRILLPEQISEAHEEGILYFHAPEYFLETMFNSSILNIQDMLDKGIVINDKLIESPKNFQMTCQILSTIILEASISQYGEITIYLKDLSKYLKKSEENIKKNITKKLKDKITNNEFLNELLEEKLKEELENGIQTLILEMNTISTSNAKNPPLTIFMYLDENDKYLKYTVMLIEELLNQTIKGLKDEDKNYLALTSPQLIYVLDKNNNLTNGKYDYLTSLTLKCLTKDANIRYISAKKMREYYDNNVFSPCGDIILPLYRDDAKEYKFKGRFNQGIVSINLTQIAILACQDETKFFNLLDERLDLCYEALMCKHRALLGTLVSISPLNFQYGGIARLNKNDVIDKLLKNGYSTISLSYSGLYESIKLMKLPSSTNQSLEMFALKILKTMHTYTEKWKKETGVTFTLQTADKISLYHLLKIDKEKFGIIKDITDKECYNNFETLDDIYEKLDFESKFQKLSPSAIQIDISKNNNLDLKKLIRYLYDNILYVKFIDKSKGEI